MSAVTLVAAGEGISVLPQSLRSVHQEAVIYRPLDAVSAFTVPLSLSYHPQHLSPFVAAARPEHDTVGEPLSKI